MNPSPLFFRCCAPSRERGVALVLILVFIVLLTVLVLAYFSYSGLQRQISQANVNQAAVDVFARGAVNTLIGDLRQEIRAGSTNLSTNAASYSVYFPRTAVTAVSAISGVATNAGLENLLKVSRSGTPFFPVNANYDTANFPSTNRAAGVSTTNSSQNGRHLMPARWNAPLLIAKANPSSSTDFTPISQFVPPDWILVARDGSNPTSWNANLRWSPSAPSSVIGRYAYVIYDEGGLLDLNAAGFPPGAATNLVGGKGSLGFADLSVIPGLTTNAITALVGWRNYVTGEAAGSFPAYTFSSSAQSNYFNFARTNSAGFLRTANTSLSGGQSDRQFVSRQQLIQFLTDGLAASPTEKASLQNALRYLSTFSRDLEQPSHRPDPNRPKNTGARLRTDSNLTGNVALAGYGGNSAYDPSGNLQDTINPPLLNVRDAAGQAVIKQRFPLRRLSLVISNPPAGSQADLKKYFGLSWDSANARWNYTSPDGNSAVYEIKTLAQIAPLGREPDFFETLKAAIESGSLGKQHGGNEVTGSPSRFTNRDAAVDGYIDFQILQIGANLIDQWDADSYPTTIHTTNGPSPNGITPEPPARNTSGVENLPYLYGWMSAWYRTRELDVATDLAPDFRPPAGPRVVAGTPAFTGKKFYETATLLQPILWNPHAPDSDSNPPGVPSQFRIIAGGTSNTGAPIPISNYPMIRSTTDTNTNWAWWTGFDTSQSSNPPEFPFNGFAQPRPYIQAVIDPASSIISFNTTPTGKAAFREPYRIQSPNYPPGSNASAYSDGTITPLDAQELNDPGQSDTLQSTAIGFYTGRSWTGPTTAGNSATSYLNMGGIRNPMRLELQYRNPTGSGPDYLTYDVIDYAYVSSSLDATSNLGIVDNDGATSSNRGLKTGVRADPRSNRWGLPTFRVSPYWNTGTLSTAPNVFPTDANPAFANLPIYPWSQGTTLNPVGTSASALFYRQIGDNQGGVPKTSGWRTLGGSTLPQGLSDTMVNLKAPPNNATASTTSIPGGKTYYTDPDGVLRRAAGAYFVTGNSAGLPMATGNSDSRPVILNRPFHSVAEMGYAFRGVAWRDLDFFTPESGDAALLDAFCLNEVDRAPENVTVAGRVNLNTRQPKVIEAILSGVSKAEGGTLSPTEAQNAAQALVDWTGDTTSNLSGILTKGPLRNRSELVGKFVSSSNASLTGLNRADVPNLDGSLAYSGFSSVLTSGGVFSTAADAIIKRRRESVMRALVDSGNTRTWNLLIDLVAQVGRYPSQASSLGQFTVEGETRFWVHLAIDRATGKVIAQQIEIVSE